MHYVQFSRCFSVSVIHCWL